MGVIESEISLKDERRQKAVEDFVRRASQGYGDRIRSITLFGSVARGISAQAGDCWPVLRYTPGDGRRPLGEGTIRPGRRTGLSP